MCGTDGCDGTEETCGEPIAVAPSTGSGAGHATAPVASDRIAPIQEIVDLFDASVVLPGTVRRHDQHGGLISELEHHIRRRGELAGRTLGFICSARLMSGIADVLAEVRRGYTTPAVADVTALQTAANALYGRVNTAGWLVDPVAAAFPAFDRRSRSTAAGFTQAFTSTEYGTRVRTFMMSSGSASAAQDAHAVLQLADVLARAIRVLRTFGAVGPRSGDTPARQLRDALEDPSTLVGFLASVLRLDPAPEGSHHERHAEHEEEGEEHGAREAAEAAVSALKVPSFFIEILTSLAVEELVHGHDQAGFAAAYRTSTNRLASFLPLGAHAREELHEACVNGRTRSAERILSEHTVAPYLASIHSLVAILEFGANMSELIEHPDLPRAVRATGSAIEAAHTTAEATVAIVRSLTCEESLLQLGRACEATGGVVAVAGAVVGIILGTIEIAEGVRDHDTSEIVHGVVGTTSSFLLLLAIAEIPGVNVAVGILAVMLIVGDYVDEAHTTAMERLFRKHLAILRVPRPVVDGDDVSSHAPERPPFCEHLGLTHAVEALERAMNDTSFWNIDARLLPGRSSMDLEVLRGAYTWRFVHYGTTRAEANACVVVT